MLRYLTAFAAFSFLSLATGPADAETDVKLPTGKEVMAKCLKASGGESLIKGIKSATIKGVAEIPEFGFKGEVAIYYRGGDARVNSDFAGQKTVQGVTDGKGWELAPTGARLMSAVETQGLLSSLSMSQVSEPEKIYKTIETVGKKDVDGQACYHLKLTRKLDDGAEQLFVSVETGLPVRAVTDKDTQFGKVDVVTTLGEYKVVDGIKTATTSSSRLEKLGMTYKAKFNSIKYNQPIDDSVFDVPEPIKTLLKK